MPLPPGPSSDGWQSFPSRAVTLLCCPHWAPTTAPGAVQLPGPELDVELEEGVEVGVAAQEDLGPGDQGYAACLWVRGPGHHRQRLA